MESEEGRRLYVTLHCRHCHHHNDSSLRWADEPFECFIEIGRGWGVGGVTEGPMEVGLGRGGECVCGG